MYGFHRVTFEDGSACLIQARAPHAEKEARQLFGDRVAKVESADQPGEPVVDERRWSVNAGFGTVFEYEAYRTEGAEHLTIWLHIPGVTETRILLRPGTVGYGAALASIPKERQEG